MVNLALNRSVKYWTNHIKRVAVIVFVINILMFSKIPVLCHWPLVWKQWLNSVIDQCLHYGRCLVSRIHDHCFYACALQLVIQTFEGPTVMQISRIYRISQNPSMLIAGCLYRIRKDFFVFPFMKLPTLRIRYADFLRFFVSSCCRRIFRIIIFIF